MRNSILRITVLLIIIGLNWTGISAVLETFAYLNDTEDSNTNNYEAGTLDFYLSSPTGNFIPPEVVISMMPGDSVTREISVIPEPESNIFQYYASTTKTGGDDDFCNALDLEANLDGVVQYSGKLMSFVSATTTFSASTDDWFFTVTLPSGTSFPPGKVCQIKFVFDGWQINLPDSSAGFFDREEIASSFATGGMKLNKVYYDVDSEHGSEYANEWIEIYNPLDTPVNISGWQICENTSCDTIPASNPVPAKGFALITASSTTWGYWQIPNEVIKIVLNDGKIGNGLANDSDRVILKMPNGSGIEDDAMSYGTDTYAFTPPCPDVAEGHILARVPTGFDTNQASDWKDLSLPQVTVIWPNGGEIVYVGRTYTLRWNATNTNGLDSSLTIDIWYSRDSGATWANIVIGEYNDGAYDWRIPLFINGYYVPSSHARIKVVAWGPENFMVQSWDMSDGDFCPPIDYSLLTPEELEMLNELGLGLSEEVVTEEVVTEIEEILPETELFNEETEEEPVVEEEVPIEEELPVVEEEPAEEIPVIEGEPIEEEVITEENQEQGGIIEEINEIIDEVIEEIVDEIMPDEETGDEIVSEPEAPVIEDVPSIVEAPADEIPTIEEQPATVPDGASSTQDGSGESISDSDGGIGDGGGDASGILGSSSLDEGAGESSGDSGVDAGGESVSE